MTTDYTDKIVSIEEQIEQLKNRQRQLKQKQSAELRKARIKRLIERGAIIESVIGAADELTGEQFKAFIKRIATTTDARRALDEIRRADGGRPAQKQAIPKAEPAAPSEPNREVADKGAD